VALIRAFQAASSTSPIAAYPRLTDLDAAIAAAARDGAEVVEYGQSVEGRPLVALHRPGRSPALLVSAGLHGLEWIGTSVAMGLWAAATDGTWSGGHELWLVPCANPDGRARVEALGGRGRLAVLRTNARGVDLNRNFPRPGGGAPSRLPFTGSDRRGRATYRGPAPLSEPESAALVQLAQRARPRGAVSLHSFMGTFIHARVREAAAFRRYGALHRAFAAAQPAGQRYRRLGSRWFDVETGEFEDYLHGALGCWAACVEVFSVGESLRQHAWAPSPFWRFNPRAPQRWVERDAAAVAAVLDAMAKLPPAHAGA
jgi:predicted deacylase